jgi:CheY-like chemotaxis protein
MEGNTGGVTAPQVEDGPPAGRRLKSSKPVALVVEMHADTRFILRRVLERSGCRVVEAADGFEAIEIAGRERPDLVLMDGRLPLLSGPDATRLIRESALLQEVLIIGLSGWEAPGFHAAALAAGCNEGLDGPIDFKRFEGLLSGLAGAAFAAG